MEYRVLVMNGQRLLQSIREGKWITDKVDKAGAIQPGIYPLSHVPAAGRSQRHQGVIIHVDREHVYQKSGKSLVRHEVREFTVIPPAGQLVDIFYQDGMAHVVKASNVLGKGVRR